MTMADLLIVRSQHNAIVTYISDKGEVFFRNEISGGADKAAVTIPSDVVDDFIREAEEIGLEVNVR